MEKQDPSSSSSPSESKGTGKVDSDERKPPSTVNVPAQSSHFLPIEGGEHNFAGRQGPSSSSENSSDNTSEEKKKRAADNQASASATTSLTDSESSSELPPREREKRRRIDYLSTAKGGLKTSNDKLLEENKKLRETIEAIKAQQDKKK